MTIILWIGGSLLALAAIGFVAQGLGRLRDRRRFPPPGRLIEVRGLRLHLHQTLPPADAVASDTPTVVFDAALGASSLSWAWVQREVGQFARAYSYDRAGMGWSDAANTPRQLVNVTAELAELLSAAKVPGPYVLVGHSYGGLVVQLYAKWHPDKVAGLVLVDAPSILEWSDPDEVNSAKRRTGIDLARKGRMAARCGLARFVSFVITRVAPNQARNYAAVQKGGMIRQRMSAIMGPAMRLPPELLPVMRSFWLQPKFYSAVAGKLEHLPEGARLLRQDPPPASIPTVVMTAGNPTPERMSEQEETVRRCQFGKHEVAENCGHWIPLEQPQLVVAAVQDVMAMARQTARVR